MQRYKSTIVTVFAVLLLVGCGYKPSAHYIQHIMQGSVYVEIQVDPQEPENAAYVKDALHQMILTRFKGSLAPKNQATNFIVASYEGTSFNPVSYSNGYITRYRADIQMEFELRTPNRVFKRSIKSEVEENINASSRLSSALRIEAIRQGMAKALDQFLAYASTQGLLTEEAQKAIIEEAKQAQAIQQ